MTVVSAVSITTKTEPNKIARYSRQVRRPRSGMRAMRETVAKEEEEEEVECDFSTRKRHL